MTYRIISLGEKSVICPVQAARSVTLAIRSSLDWRDRFLSSVVNRRGRLDLCLSCGGLDLYLDISPVRL